MSVSNLRTGQYFGNARRQIEASGIIFTELRHRHKLVLPFHTHESAYFAMLLKGGYEEWCSGRTQRYLLNEVIFHPDDFGHHDSITTPDTLLLCIAMPRSVQDLMRTRSSVRDVSPRVLRGSAVLSALRMREWVNAGCMPDALELEESALELLAAANQWRSPMDAFQPVWLKCALEMLHERFLTQITLQSLAAEVKIHPLHLSRTFRKFHGCSPVHYLRRLRVEFASTQIRSTDMPLSCVAAMSGFADQSHMNRLFKHFLHSTPGRIRALPY
jgi:AraC family transcriptional regulator